MELTATLNNNGKNNHTDKLTQIGSTITVIDPHQNTQSTLLQKPEITLSETSKSKEKAFLIAKFSFSLPSAVHLHSLNRITQGNGGFYRYPFDIVELTATLNNDSNIDTDKLTQIESTIATNDPYQNSQTPLLQKPEMWRRMLIHRALYRHLKLSHIPYCFVAAEMGLDLIENRKKLGWTFLTQQVSL